MARIRLNLPASPRDWLSIALHGEGQGAADDRLRVAKFAASDHVRHVRERNPHNRHVPLFGPIRGRARVQVG